MPQTVVQTVVSSPVRPPMEPRKPRIPDGGWSHASRNPIPMSGPRIPDGHGGAKPSMDYITRTVDQAFTTVSIKSKSCPPGEVLTAVVRTCIHREPEPQEMTALTNTWPSAVLTGLRKGDVIVRRLDTWHRGTPHKGDAVRHMLAFIFGRNFRPY